MELDLDWLRDLSGLVGRSNITISDVDNLNTGHINSRITDIVTKNYFRYFKVHVHRFCKLRANAKNCDDDLCVLDTAQKNGASSNDLGDIKPMKRNGGPRQTTEWEIGECDTCYCVNLEQETEDLTYFDLVFNTEQYTGYDGRHIWNILYNSIAQISGQDLRELIFRTISGLHSSVNIHLCYKYVKQKDQEDVSVESIVRPNPEELAKRFHPKWTDKQGPSWVRNLYFAYLIVLRGIAEGEHYWRILPIDTGDKQVDKDTRNLLMNFTEISSTYLKPMEEERIFANPDLNQFCSVYFQNVSGAFDHIT